MTESSQGNPARTALLIDVLYAVAIGINLWILLDQMTGGELNRTARQTFAAHAEKIAANRKARRQERHDRFEMFQQVSDIVNEGAQADGS